MKILHLGIFFALWICLEAMEVRQISRLIPIEDWIDFKTRTSDVKPLDKLIGKLRGTYDFVFHKADNVSNVEKILDETIEDLSENSTRINSTDLDTKNYEDESDNISSIENESMKTKLLTDEDPDDEIDQRSDTLEEHENLDDTLALEHLEIVDDDDLLDMYDEEPETVEKKNQTPHSRFSVPYAIFQAIVRWLITLYYSSLRSPAPADPVTRESA